MIWSGTGNTTGSLKPCHEDQAEASPNMPPLSSPSMLFSQQFPHSSSGLVHMNGGSTPLASLHDGNAGSQESHMPESWSQLILGGLVGDQERYSTTTALLSKGLENWGDHQQAAAAASACMVGMKEEGSMAQSGSGAAAPYNFYGSHLAASDSHEIQAKSQLSQMIMASSPRSCVTTSLGSNMLDFSNSAVVPPPPELRNHHHHHSDNSSECNSTATGSALKKARVQASSSAQSTLKVRKERLGDRITALHQIVSPFGKTDTASVLQETIGYVRFLLGQIEALSYPYMGHGGNGTSVQNGPTGEKNPGLFPEYPGQLLNHNNNTGGVQQQAGGQPEPQVCVSCTHFAYLQSHFQSCIYVAQVCTLC